MYPTGLDEQKLSYWGQMTDNNLHTEVLVDICDWAVKACVAQREYDAKTFYEESKNLFLAILKSRYIDSTIAEMRYYASKMLIEMIANDFGRDSANEIWNVL